MAIPASFCLAVGVSLLIASRLRRSLGGEPGHMEHLAGRIADGDLTVETSAEAGTGIHAAMNRMVANLRSMIGDITSAADAIRSAAGEIAQGNTDLSRCVNWLSVAPLRPAR